MFFDGKLGTNCSVARARVTPTFRVPTLPWYLPNVTLGSDLVQISWGSAGKFARFSMRDLFFFRSSKIQNLTVSVVSGWRMEDGEVGARYL
jgi:hypothetical protein